MNDARMSLHPTSASTPLPGLIRAYTLKRRRNLGKSLVALGNSECVAGHNLPAISA